MPLPPAAPLTVADADRKQLVALSRQTSIPRGILLRVNIVLGAADGQANHLLARDLSTTVTTVLLWRKRYQTEGLAGLFEDRPRSGRPKRISESKEAAIVAATMKTVPKDATHWSVRAMATSQKVSPSCCNRKPGGSATRISCGSRGWARVPRRCIWSVPVRGLRADVGPGSRIRQLGA
jgi:hypothetical protein